jgi:type II secretory pathway pseudopilin PulG
VRAGSLQLSSRGSRADRGFTLLELTIAMTFVIVLAGGIALSISTCVNVWRRAQEMADLNQEARAVSEVLSRDIRGAYLGLNRNSGYFLGTAGYGYDQLALDPTVPSDELLEFSTESSAMTRLALMPRDQSDTQTDTEDHPVTSDFVVVRYVMHDPTGDEPGGLWRLTWVAPRPEWLDEPPPIEEAVSIEPISESVVGLRLEYYDGESWLSDWRTSEQGNRLPKAVAVEMRLLDSREKEHVYQSVIPVPSA